MELQELGCHNLNLVTPTHVAAAVASALASAFPRGLTIPVVWNSGGYESADILRTLEPCVDIYLPDLKFLDPSLARDITDAADYPCHATAAVQEMFRQKGPLRLHNGLAVSGVIVRHLVLPDHLANTRQVLRFLAEEVSPDITVSLMAQYHPAWKAYDVPPLNRPLHPEEYLEAVRTARSLGLRNLILQDLPGL